jgi:hypothetical protein
MLASLPPSETRYESSCVNRTLVTWLPWPPYMRLGAWAKQNLVATAELSGLSAHPSGPHQPHLGARARVLEEMDFAEVIRHCYHTLIM